MAQMNFLSVPFLATIMLIMAYVPSWADLANKAEAGKVYEVPVPSDKQAEEIARQREAQQDKLLNDLYGQVTQLQKKLEKAEHRLAHARYRQAYYAELERQRHHLKEPGADKPLPFSHFADQTWREEVEALRRSLAYEQAFPLPMVVESLGYMTFGGNHNPVVDGVWEIGMDVFWLTNNVTNKIRIMAPAFKADGTPLVVIADPGIDDILLDGCLTWTQKEPDGGLDVWEAKDKDGKTAALKLNRGLKPKIEQPCDNRYLLRQIMRFMPAILGEPRDEVDEGSWAMMAPLPYTDESVERLVPQPEQDLISYKTDFFKDAKKESLKRLVIDQMENGTVPSRLPEWQYSEKRNLVFTLEKPSLKEGANEKVLQLSNANSEMLVLEKGWGNYTATGSCALADMKDTVFAIRKELPNTMGGIGVYPDRDSNGQIQISIDQNGGAAAAGLKSDDVITGIEGMRVDQMDDATAISKLRGKPGTTVTVTGNFKSASSPVTITRKALSDDDAIQGLARADIDWPYPFYNFIIFGPDLYEADLVWTKDKKRLKNKKTKDEIIFPVPACYSLIYTAGARSK